MSQSITTYDSACQNELDCLQQLLKQQLLIQQRASDVHWLPLISQLTMILASIATVFYVAIMAVQQRRQLQEHWRAISRFRSELSNRISQRYQRARSRYRHVRSSWDENFRYRQMMPEPLTPEEFGRRFPGSLIQPGVDAEAEMEELDNLLRMMDDLSDDMERIRQQNNPSTSAHPIYADVIADYNSRGEPVPVSVAAARMAYRQKLSYIRNHVLLPHPPATIGGNDLVRIDIPVREDSVPQNLSPVPEMDWEREVYRDTVDRSK